MILELLVVAGHEILLMPEVDTDRLEQHRLLATAALACEAINGLYPEEATQRKDLYQEVLSFLGLKSLVA